jgi:hypothetical protein
MLLSSNIVLNFSSGLDFGGIENIL